MFPSFFVFFFFWQNANFSPTSFPFTANATIKGTLIGSLKARLHRAILSRDKGCDKIAAKLH